MFRFTVALFSVFMFASLFFQAGAAPLHARQVGNLTCNKARLQTVVNLSATRAAVDEFSDASNTDAQTTATTNLDAASAGIKTIGQALLAGEDAPAAARDDVEAALTAAKTALDGITAGTADDAAVAQAQASLDKTITASQQVVATCK